MLQCCAACCTVLYTGVDLGPTIIFCMQYVVTCFTVLQVWKYHRRRSCLHFLMRSASLTPLPLRTDNNIVDKTENRHDATRRTIFDNNDCQAVQASKGAGLKTARGTFTKEAGWSGPSWSMPSCWRPSLWITASTCFWITSTRNSMTHWTSRISCGCCATWHYSPQTLPHLPTCRILFSYPHTPPWRSTHICTLKAHDISATVMSHHERTYVSTHLEKYSTKASC